MEPKTKIGILAILAIGLLAVGMFLYGMLLYNSVLAHPTPLTELEGFALFSSTELNVEYYSLSIESIDTSKKSATVSLRIHFSTKASTDENVILVARNPCDFEILDNSEIRSWTGGFQEFLFEPNIKKVEDKTYFWHEFQAQHDYGYEIIFNLNWENYLSQLSYSKFHLVIPFDLPLALPDDFNNLGLNLGSASPITPDIPDRSSASVGLPLESINRYMIPAPDSITYYNENTWYFWDLKSRSDPDKYASTAISIDFESSHLLDEKEREIFLAGVLIAAGAGMITSLVVSVLVKLCIRGDKKSKKVFEKKARFK